MLVKDLELFNSAPAQGYMLAYFRKKILFEKYVDIAKVKIFLENEEMTKEELLELHLFDSEKEYRCVSTRSKRFPKGIIEHVSDFEFYEGTESVFAETVLLENETGTLTVLNHIDYNDENGMAIVDDYRLKR